MIRNITAEFLSFTSETGEWSVEVLYANENVWATQKVMRKLYGCSKSNISEHLTTIFANAEISENPVVRNFRTTGADVIIVIVLLIILLLLLLLGLSLI